MDFFRADPHPDHPGWLSWELRETGRFNDLIGPTIVRRDPDGKGRVRMLLPERRHSNLLDAIHGGALLAFVDVALFGGARMCGIENVSGAQTIECGVQFIAPGQLGTPLDAVVELLRETGRMAFLRGLLVQGDTIVAAFSGTIRKARA
jgi:acyl-coenzyme A thioesterase PaaI-like protein